MLPRGNHPYSRRICPQVSLRDSLRDSQLLNLRGSLLEIHLANLRDFHRSSLSQRHHRYPRDNRAHSHLGALLRSRLDYRRRNHRLNLRDNLLLSLLLSLLLNRLDNPLRSRLHNPVDSLQCSLRGSHQIYHRCNRAEILQRLLLVFLRLIH